MSKTLINIANKHDRTVVLVDMDCFYCQVEEKLNPTLKGKPIAVVQYNAWKGGGIIAVNYAARDRGVTRHMRGDQAKSHCPEIELVKVPSVREKADLTKYREAGKDVASVLQRFTTLLERASVDEAYLDITENVKKRFKEMSDGSFVLTPDKLLNCYAVGYDHIGEYIQNLSKTFSANKGVDKGTSKNDNNEEKGLTKYDIKLLIGASIVNEIREAVKKETGFECSAGIAHNKILAKLVCGMNKPNKQTILPVNNVIQLFSNLPIHKIKGLGGKFGEDVCDKLKIKLMSELNAFSLTELQKSFDDKTGLWLFQMARGIDLEAVTPRFASKSIGCCKKFPGRNSIKGIATLNHWLTELSKEIVERLEKDEIENSRVAKQIVVSFTQQFAGEEVASTRCIPLNSIDVETIAQDALEVIKKNTEMFFKNDQNTVILNPITLLGISAGKFDDFNNQQKKNTIKDMFSKAILNDASKKNEKVKEENELEGNGEDPKPTSNTSDCKMSNIKSFFSVVKDDDASELDENDCAVEGEIDNESIHSMDGIVESDADPIIDATSTEIINSNSIPDETNETTSETTVTSIPAGRPSYQYERDDEKPGPSNQPDYKETYVEFLQPTIPDDFYEICGQCNKKLLIIEMQSHTDMHLAFQLSEEQRIEFRSQLKTKSSIKSTSPVAKKPKLDRSTNSIHSGISTSSRKVVRNTSATSLPGSNSGSSSTLTRYFEQKKEEPPEESVKCDECGKFVKIENVAEHSDYHAAKKLQMEINSISTSAVISNSSTKDVKTKSRTDSNSKKRSIASFFKTTN